MVAIMKFILALACVGGANARGKRDSPVCATTTSAAPRELAAL